MHASGSGLSWRRPSTSPSPWSGAKDLGGAVLMEESFRSSMRAVMTQIPKILHYIFFSDLKYKDRKKWSLVHYICVRSAVERIRPDITYFHCDREPDGPWWELTR